MSSVGNKAIMAKNLKYYIERSGKERRELAEIWGFPYSTVTEWINGRKYPRIDRIEVMADYFGIQKSDLIEDKLGAEPEAMVAPDIMPVPNFVRVPRLGTIACGKPILAVEDAEHFDFIPEGIECDFTLQCKGDSMVNARIFDGDIVFIKAQTMVDNGEIAAVLIGEETTLKRVYYDKAANVLQLMPENPAYPIMRYIGPELNDIRILGKAVKFMSNVI